MQSYWSPKIAYNSPMSKLAYKWVHLPMLASARDKKPPVVTRYTIFTLYGVIYQNLRIETYKCNDDDQDKTGFCFGLSIFLPT